MCKKRYEDVFDMSRVLHSLCAWWANGVLCEKITDAYMCKRYMGDYFYSDSRFHEFDELCSEHCLTGTEQDFASMFRCSPSSPFRSPLPSLSLCVCSVCLLHAAPRATMHRLRLRAGAAQFASRQRVPHARRSHREKENAQIAPSQIMALAVLGVQRGAREGATERRS